MVIIRRELPEDFSAIDEVIRAAFEIDARSHHNEQAIVRALRASSQLTLSLVAEFERRVVGHIAVSPVLISDGTPGWHGLGPVAVSPHRQGQGIGQQLVRGALGRLREMGAGGCVLLGEPGFYGRFGFKADSELILPGIPAEFSAFFQALRFADPQPRGKVTYHESFSAR